MLSAPSIGQSAARSEPRADAKFIRPTIAIPIAADPPSQEPAEEQDTQTIPMFGLDNEPAPLPPSKPTPAPAFLQAAAVEAEERELIDSSNFADGMMDGADDLEPMAEELRYLKEHWIEAVNLMRHISSGGVPLMNDATPISQVGQVITLEFTMKTHTDKLAENPKRLERVQEVINKALKKPPRTFTVRAVLRGEHEPFRNGRKPGKPETQQRAAAAAKPLPVPDDGPSDLLDEVIAVFGGRIIEDDNSKR
jgi:hypothetical protein